MTASAPPPTQRFTIPSEDGARVLDVAGVGVSFDGRRVLDDVTFWVPKGEFVCLSGPNGAGKSTLLKTILGLIRPDEGTVSILGRTPREAGRAVGYVPQRKTFDRDFPATVLDLIVANLRGRWPLRVTEPERAATRHALKRVGGEKLIDRSLANLSGGETQRAFLARALVTEPALVILDEPTAGVDVRGRAEFLDLLAAISQSDEIAAVLVTHNLAAVSRCAERVVYLDGRVVAWGLPHELLGMQSLTALAFGAKDHARHTAPDED
jgi:ABC-type Mn2+/Zn2+ transport system ATPase subunit